jgi:hypothetical protein
MRFLCALIAVLAIVGCKTQPPPEVAPYCGIMFSAVTGAAQGIAQAFDCSNAPAIAADLSKPIEKLNICPKDGQTQQGLIGDIVCPQVTSFVLGLGVGALPKNWDCKGGKPAEDMNKFLTAKCKAAVSF